MNKRQVLQTKLQERIRLLKNKRTRKECKNRRNKQNIKEVGFDIAKVSKSLMVQISNEPTSISAPMLARKYREMPKYKKLYNAFPKIFEHIIKRNVRTEDDLNALKSMLLQRQQIQEGKLDFDQAQYAMGEHLFNKFGGDKIEKINK